MSVAPPKLPMPPPLLSIVLLPEKVEFLTSTLPPLFKRPAPDMVVFAMSDCEVTQIEHRTRFHPKHLGKHRFR